MIVPEMATAPTPWLIVTDVVSVVVHVNVADCPCVIETGAAPSVAVGAGRDRIKSK